LPCPGPFSNQGLQGRHGNFNLRRTQAMDVAIIERELLSNRNQFQSSHIMDEAIQVDLQRDIYKPPQRTFHPEVSHLRTRKAAIGPRPMSTGSIFPDEEPQLVSKPRAKPIIDSRDRTDWAQRDDVVENRQDKRDWASQFLRKRESKWTMRIKKDMFIGQDKDDTVADIGNFGPTPVSSKGGKGRFLARFKRHPN
jgi:hypothetical protein